MKITAKLALTGLKVNKMRSFWAIVGIALSNALLVTICTFVASGLDMISGTISGASNAAEIYSTYLSIITLPAIFIIFLIAFMTQVVISNVFKVSANQKIAEFGILKCTGATKKQIKSIILHESIFLSVVAIPLGVILGIILSYIAVNVTNLFLDEINALASVMITEFSVYLTYTFSPIAILISSIICFLVVLFSANKPAKTASKTSAIDAIRGTNCIKITKKKVRFSKLINKLFGFEGELANKNITRNSANFKATQISLTVGVTLIVSLGGITLQANSLMKVTALPHEQSYVVDYTSSRTRQINSATGLEESVFAKPINSDIGEEITKKLADFQGAEVFGSGRDGQTFYAVLTDEFLTEDMKMLLDEQIVLSEGSSTENYTLQTAILTLDEQNYKKLCEKIGADENANILINTLGYNDFGYEKYITPYLETMEQVDLQKADGTVETFEIDAFLDYENLPNEFRSINSSPFQLIVPKAEVRTYSWCLTPSDEEAFESYAWEILEEYFPTNEDDEYMEQGFSTRIFRTDEYSKVMNIAIFIFLVALSSFAVLLMLIGFTNIVSTLVSNVFMRADEFAVLQSLGMTKKGLLKMLMLESLLCTAKALIVGITIGTAITFSVNLGIRGLFPILFEFPFVAVVGCIFGVLAITLGITKLSVNSLSRKNIIETIRNKG